LCVEVAPRLPSKARLRCVVLPLGGIFDLCGYIGNLRLTDGGQSGARDFGFCHPFNAVRSHVLTSSRRADDSRCAPDGPVSEARRHFHRLSGRRNRVRCGLSGYFAFQPDIQTQQWRKPPRVSSGHDLKHRMNHRCRALEASVTVAGSLTRSLLRDQCVLLDGCVTSHASIRATPRIGRCTCHGRAESGDSVQPSRHFPR
jgi:hypothetical protein